MPFDQAAVLSVLLLVSFCAVDAWADDASGGKSAPAGFAEVAGWGVLRWDQRLPEAREALTRAKIAFKERPMRKDATTHLVLQRDLDQGVIYFDARERMVQILFQSPELPGEADARVRLQALEKRWGPAHEKRTQAYEDSGRTDEFHVWSNASTQLRLTLAHYPEHWIVWEAFTPAEPPVDPETEGPSEGPLPVLNERPNPPMNCRNMKDLEANGAATVRIFGVYRVVDMVRKWAEVQPDGTIVTSNKTVLVELEDGTRVRVGIRTEEEHRLLAGKRVHLVGRVKQVTQPDPAPVMTKVDSVEEAPE